MQDKEKKKENDKGTMPSLLLKAAFWMLTTFTLIMLSSFLVPGDNTQNEVYTYINKFDLKLRYSIKYLLNNICLAKFD